MLHIASIIKVYNPVNTFYDRKSSLSFILSKYNMNDTIWQLQLKN